MSEGKPSEGALRALKVKWICQTILEIAFFVFLAYALQACLRHCAG